MKQIYEAYELLVHAEAKATQQQRIPVYEGLTSQQAADKLRDLSDIEQQACCIMAPEHNDKIIIDFLSTLLGAEMEPAFVDIVDGHDNNTRMSLDSNSIMLFGLLTDLSMCHLVRKVAGIKSSNRILPSPFDNATAYTLFTAAVRWVFGEWVEEQMKQQQEQQQTKKRSRTTQQQTGTTQKKQVVKKFGVCYAHDVTPLDNSDNMILRQVYEQQGLSTSMSSQVGMTWLTPSPAQRSGLHPVNKPVFIRLGENITCHMGHAAAAVEALKDRPVDMSITLLCDDGLGARIRDYTATSEETVDVGTAVQLPVGIER